MQALKFSANLSWLFTKETPHLVERYALARQHDFNCVECAYPYGVPISDIQKAKEDAGVEQLLINSYPGDTQAGEFGFAAIPDKVNEFRDSLELSIEYAKALNCKKIHVMSGCFSEKFSFENMESTYLDNLKYAGERLSKEGIQALVEPTNDIFTIKNYFMNSPSRAYQYIQKLHENGDENIKYQLDIYHQQIMEGNLTVSIEKYWPYVAHIQIAQAPHRNEPMEQGEINYSYIFQLFKDLKYDGYIGLEHKCSGINSSQSFEWLKSVGYEL